MALKDSLTKSNLDRNDGKTPPNYTPGVILKNSLSNSLLDLDGKTPSKYTDNLPG
jgi:hypothetical protein